MKHLQDDDLLDAYFDREANILRGHLDLCVECRGRFEDLKKAMDTLPEYRVPDRNASYGAEVWARLTPHLALEKPHRFWTTWWFLGPACAALLVIVFLAGRFSRPGPGFSAKTSDRVLLLAISDHLERSEVVLTELVHAGPDDANAMALERQRARHLLGSNRLLRESAARLGDVSDSALLDDLERVLTEIANAPASAAPRESADVLRTIQDRIDDNGLLFKVRITAADSRKKGQRL